MIHYYVLIFDSGFVSGGKKPLTTDQIKNARANVRLASTIFQGIRLSEECYLFAVNDELDKVYPVVSRGLSIHEIECLTLIEITNPQGIFPPMRASAIMRNRPIIADENSKQNPQKMRTLRSQYQDLLNDDLNTAIDQWLNVTSSTIP